MMPVTGILAYYFDLPTGDIHELGKPAFIVLTAEMLADLKGVSFDTLAQATTDNFFRLFKKAKRQSS